MLVEVYSEVFSFMMANVLFPISGVISATRLRNCHPVSIAILVQTQYCTNLD